MEINEGRTIANVDTKDPQKPESLQRQKWQC